MKNVQQTPEQVTRQLQMITGAMIMGLVTFAIVAIAIGQGDAPVESPIISMISVGMLVMASILAAILPTIIEASARREMKRQSASLSSETALAGLYQTTTIIRLALYEGPGFMAVVAYMLEHHAWSFGVVFASIVFMALQIPTSTTIPEWIRQKIELEQLDAPEDR